VLGRVQPQYTSNTTVIINILRERYNPAFIATTFSGFISRNTAPVSSTVFVSWAVKLMIND